MSNTLLYQLVSLGLLIDPLQPGFLDTPTGRDVLGQVWKDFAFKAQHLGSDDRFTKANVAIAHFGPKEIQPDT